MAIYQITDRDISHYMQGCILNFLEHMNAQDRIPMMISLTKQLPREMAEKAVILFKKNLAEF